MNANYLSDKWAFMSTKVAKRFLYVFILILCQNTFSQNAMVGDGFGGGWGGACNSNFQFAYFSGSFGTSYMSNLLTPSATGNRYFRPAIDFGGTVKQISAGSDVSVSPNTTYTSLLSCTTTGAYFVNVMATTKRYIIKTNDASSSPSGKFVVFEFATTPSTITSVTVPSVAMNNAASITATISANLPAGQGVYLRYTNDNFVTTAVVQMTGSGVSYSANIPSAINSSGKTVKYYVFSSGSANVALDGSNADFYSINLNNNSNANYSYVVKSIVSAKVYFKVGSNATQYYGANLNTSCDAGQTSDLSAGTPTVATVLTGQNIFVGGNLIANSIASPKMNYQIYLDGSATGAFSQINLSSASSPACGTKQELSETNTIISTTGLAEGTYVVEVYFENNGAFLNNNGINYKARFRIINEVGIAETYAYVKLNGTSNNYFNLDGALGSSNPNLPTDLGTYEPGLVFNLGAEMKTYNLGTTQSVCSCTNWYYIYDTATPDPLDTDFPLPVNGVDFLETGNGKFRQSSSLSFDSAAGFVGSTANTGYNSLINSNVKKFTNTGTGIDSQIVFPTCEGSYKVAIAMMAKISKTGNCSDPTSLVYYRDINQDLRYKWDTGTDVLLNPNRTSNPIAMYSGQVYSANGNNGTVKNSITPLFYTTKITINDTSSTTWNGSSWTTALNGNDRGRNLTFSGDYTVSSDLISVNSMTINNGVTVTVPDGKYIEVFNGISTIGTGKVVVANQANLVQRCDASTINKPQIVLTKTTMPKRKWDYEYLGSPISENIFSVIPAPYDREYFWKSGFGGGWNTLTAADVLAGKGFIARVSNSAPYNATPTPINWAFAGTANNGLFSIAVTKENNVLSNPNNTALLSNPYPSAIDGASFLLDPANTHLKGSLYFWTSATQYFMGNNYSQADFAIWSVGSGAVSANGITPNGKIASGQGFFVALDDNGNATFKDYMRSKDQNTQFFRSSNAENVPINRYWINLKDGNSVDNQILIAYVAGATTGFDSYYDAPRNSVATVQLHSLIGQDRMAINGRPEFNIADEVMVGVKKIDDSPQNLTLTLTAKEGIFDSQNTAIYLYDNVLDVYSNLQDGPYSYISTAVEENNRFKIVYQAPLKTKTENLVQLFAHIKNHKLIIVASENIKNIKIYDLSGRKIDSFSNTENSKNIDRQFNYESAIYIAKIELESGKIISKKLIN